MTIRVWGIAACDRCRQARRTLDAQGMSYHWRDLREAPPEPSELGRWLDLLGTGQLVNRRSTTWRSLDAEQRAMLETDPVALLAAHPLLVRRPLIERDGQIRVGFDEATRRWLGLS
ncbi:MAG: ArsC family reductase [Wenzhouxiangellaceae bacterium]